MCVCNISRRRDAKGALNFLIFSTPLTPLEISYARAHVFHPPHNHYLPKLETTYSLGEQKSPLGHNWSFALDHLGRCHFLLWLQCKVKSWRYQPLLRGISQVELGEKMMFLRWGDQYQLASKSPRYLTRVPLEANQNIDSSY